MITEKELQNIENDLIERGLDENIRQNIRNSRICMIDDKVEDLKSLIKALAIEGFKNIEDYKKVSSVNEILKEKFDLILLDLNGVAKEIDNEDGLGILEKLKSSSPETNLIVITGQKINASKLTLLNKADLVLDKPVKASNLAFEIEKLLLVKYDKFWASLKILKELKKIDNNIKEELSFTSKICYTWNRNRLAKNLIDHDNKVIKRLETIYKILKLAVPAAGKVINVIDFLKKT
jgi:DNA-binding response OmpR family regulator